MATWPSEGCATCTPAAVWSARSTAPGVGFFRQSVSLARDAGQLCKIKPTLCVRRNSDCSSPESPQAVLGCRNLHSSWWDRRGAPALMPRENTWPHRHLANSLHLFPAWKMSGLTPAVLGLCPQIWGVDGEHPGQERNQVENTTKVSPENKPVREATRQRNF